MKYICLGYIEPGKPEMSEEQQRRPLLRDQGAARRHSGARGARPESCHSAYPSAPGVKYGPWEIRPAADLSDMVKQSEQRRRKRTAD